MRELKHPPHVVRIFNDPQEAARQLATDLAGIMNGLAENNPGLSLALSGGNTPLLLFREFTGLSDRMPVEKLQLFWVDERAVPPDSKESNYGQAYREWLVKVKFPEQQIHRIQGEHEPEKEAERYAGLLSALLPVTDNGIPRLDMVLLGLGSDGHTASLFPGDHAALSSDKTCISTSHPRTSQPRISMTPALINNASRVFFLVTGKEKSTPLSAIIENKKEAGDYPGHRIRPSAGRLFWYTDRAAATEIS